MSTRATYQIEFTTIYIHHDGYPDGAAMYFRNAFQQRLVQDDRAPNATFADDFIRANDRAELTPSHDSHGDTEYRYTVKVTGDERFGDPDYQLTAESRSFSDNRWETFYQGSVDDFINQYPGLLSA